MNVRAGSVGDLARWNEFVSRHPEATPYHLMGWALAVQRAYGHDPVLLIAEQADRIAGVLPICLMRVPLVGRVLCSLPFCDVGGPLAINAAAEDALLQEALRLAQSEKATLHMRSRQPDDSVDENHSGKVSMLLDLPETSDELAASFKSKLRSQIRKAEKNGLTFLYGGSEREIAMFYPVFAKNMRDLGSPVHSKSWFQAIEQQLSGDLTIGIVKLGDQAIGAGIALRAGGMASIPWASTLREFNRLAPNMLLYWNLLKIVTDAGADCFDFGRSSYGEGTYRFKKQWGARPVPLRWRDYDASGACADIEANPGRARRVVSSMWQHLPLFAANALGPRLRKYVSL